MTIIQYVVTEEFTCAPKDVKERIENVLLCYQNPHPLAYIFKAEEKYAGPDAVTIGLTIMWYIDVDITLLTKLEQQP